MVSTSAVPACCRNFLATTRGSNALRVRRIAWRHVYDRIWLGQL
jgi:hypothetical protein